MASFDYIADALSNAVTSAAPAVNTVLASLTTPAKGEYIVRAFIFVSGAAETQPLNVRVRSGSTELCRLITAQNLLDSTSDTFVVSVDGATNIDMQVVANATAATVYTSRLTATRTA